MAAVTIIGGPVSPYVRKVLAILSLKSILFELDPIVPFFGNDEFSRLSPLRRIPVLIDGDLSIADSSVIAQYLEETRPQPAMLPATPSERARARWLEEFADSRIGDVFIWRCFNAAVVNPSVWGGERNLKVLQETLAGPVVDIMDYLESVAPASGFLFGAIGLADISVAAMFRNLRYCRWTPDAARWPRTARWIDAVDAHPAIARINAWSDALVKTPIEEHRAEGEKLGLPLTRESMLANSPRRGPMSQTI
jgi:glutathione S-transferase